jgi:type IV pilus assembly protein PilM
VAGLTQVVEAAADEVGVGIERAAAFLMTRQSGEGIGKIYLSGGGARIPGMADALTRRMTVRTELVNPFQRIPVDPAAGAGLNLEEASPMLLLSLGLALRTA